MAGETDKMVVLVRGDTDHYTCETGLAPLSEIANGVKKLPTEWINEDGVSMNFQFFRYALPLIQGEVPVPYDNGLPLFARLEKHRIEKALPPYEVGGLFPRPARGSRDFFQGRSPRPAFFLRAVSASGRTARSPHKDWGGSRRACASRRGAARGA